jgi:hypothetical protein
MGFEKLHGLLTLNEAAPVDGSISKPDGSEEGNVVGKFLDTLPATDLSGSN